MKERFDDISYKISKAITTHYSTSFSIGIRLLHPTLRGHIYNIYGYVRLADEVVDSFEKYDKNRLLQELKLATTKAIRDGISINPVLNSFQFSVNKFQIPKMLLDSFLKSMEMDLDTRVHDRESYEEYIFGSAEAVGLMCLWVFCNGDMATYDRLQPFAQKLGSAFQKVNFLRDIQADAHLLGRQYFPHFDFRNISDTDKRAIEREIEAEFDAAAAGIKLLPSNCKRGVYIAYIYYRHLLKKVKQASAKELCNKRLRVSNFEKMGLLLRHQLFPQL